MRTIGSAVERSSAAGGTRGILDNLALALRGWQLVCHALAANADALCAAPGLVIAA